LSAGKWDETNAEKKTLLVGDEGPDSPAKAEWFMKTGWKRKDVG